MGENFSSDYGCGCLSLGLGLAGLVGMITLGPIDLARTGYNAAVGDVSVIRERALAYARKSLRRENPSLSDDALESMLALEVKYPLTSGEKINAQKVEMDYLWDATEEHANSWYQRWVWPRLDD